MMKAKVIKNDKVQVKTSNKQNQKRKQRLENDGVYYEEECKKRKKL